MDLALGLMGKEKYVKYMNARNQEKCLDLENEIKWPRDMKLTEKIYTNWR